MTRPNLDNPVIKDIYLPLHFMVREVKKELLLPITLSLGHEMLLINEDLKSKHCNSEKKTLCQFLNSIEIVINVIIM